MTRHQEKKDSFARELTPMEKEAYQAYRRLMDALCKSDTVLLRSLMDENVRMSGVNGRDRKLEEFLEELKRGDISYSGIELQRVQVHLVFEESGEDEPAEDEPAEVESAEAESAGAESVQLESAEEEAEENSDPGADSAADCYATVTGVSLQRARIYGMKGFFHRHFVARLRRRDGRWTYIGE